MTTHATLTPAGDDAGVGPGPSSGSGSNGGRPLSATLRRAFAWHPPLMTVGGLMAVCAVIALVGMWLDPRVILGAPAWAKPLKFSLSILLYTVTWAWLIAHLPRWQKFARRLGTVIAVTLAIEQVLIAWAAATGTTSHFNVSDGVHVIVWAIMAVSITIMYLATFLTSVALVFLRLPAPALTLAVRAGAAIALVGIGVAFLMTGPTPSQLTEPTGIIGAHAVGIADGGPGLPILGWSLVGGDYRVAHFVGMHALQILPLFALLVSVVGARIPRLRRPDTQTRIMAVAAAAYALATVLLTYQAFVGQSVAHPAGVVLVAAVVITVAALVAAAIVLLRAQPQYRIATTAA